MPTNVPTLLLLQNNGCIRWVGGMRGGGVDAEVKTRDQKQNGVTESSTIIHTKAVIGPPNHSRRHGISFSPISTRTHTYTRTCRRRR